MFTLWEMRNNNQVPAAQGSRISLMLKPNREGYSYRHSMHVIPQHQTNTPPSPFPSLVHPSLPFHRPLPDSPANFHPPQVIHTRNLTNSLFPFAVFRPKSRPSKRQNHRLHTRPVLPHLAAVISLSQEPVPISHLANISTPKGSEPHFLSLSKSSPPSLPIPPPPTSLGSEASPSTLLATLTVPTSSHKSSLIP